ncbi:MAG: hypothetical protein EWM72_03311 [Nitrospira sp.]|nr:MAG: hypothetical protein EWM72_03311 [Nitrospira sp.]
MSKSDAEREKQELLRALAETKEIAPQLIEKGRNLTEAGQSALDLASIVESVASKAPAEFFRHPTFANVSSGFREFNSVAQTQYGQITEDVRLLGILHSTTTTTSVTTFAVAFASFGSTTDAMPELKSMEMLLHRSVDVAKVRESMKTLGLDATHGDIRSPVMLLCTAEEALRRPFANEGYATAVLVPLRESIQGCVDELLKLRPTVEKAGGWADKVASIARHCGKIANSPDHVDRVAATTYTLINELSAAKDRQMNRDRIVALFDQGVSVLEDIVFLVDRDRLRSDTK